MFYYNVRFWDEKLEVQEAEISFVQDTVSNCVMDMEFICHLVFPFKA